MTGEEFRVWREAIGWSQARAGEVFKVSRNTIINWEATADHLLPAVRALCDLYTREHKKRPEHGPVVLLYSTGRLMRSPYSSDPAPTLKSEYYELMAGALARVDELWGRTDFCHPSIQDDGETLWNLNELQQRAHRLGRVAAA
jgi:transcriptional regulator with XRE-family HTH domain